MSNYDENCRNAFYTKMTQEEPATRTIRKRIQLVWWKSPVLRWTAFFCFTFVVGFLTTFCTGLLIGKAAAHLPGGSIVSGFQSALLWRKEMNIKRSHAFILGTLAGFFGFLFAILLFR